MKYIKSFKFQHGDLISNRYQVISRLGKGWESEVYLVKEKGLQIERAIKIFFPHKNKQNKTAIYHAKKLHKLRACSMLIQYHTMEKYKTGTVETTYLVSEYIEGELLSTFIERQPGGRIHPFQALHLFHTLVKGIEEIHVLGEYHGDLHTDNIIIHRHGLYFDIKVVDFFHWKGLSKGVNMQDDVVALVHMLYDITGGKDHYNKLPQALKDIILGKRKDLITKKFRNVSRLREYIETMEW